MFPHAVAQPARIPTSVRRLALAATLATIGAFGLAPGAQAASTTFSTAGTSTYVVPAGVTQVVARVTTPAANSFLGFIPQGRSALVIARIPVTPGESLRVEVSGSQQAPSSVRGAGSATDRAVVAGGGGSTGFRETATVDGRGGDASLPGQRANDGGGSRGGMGASQSAPGRAGSSAGAAAVITAPTDGGSFVTNAGRGGTGAVAANADAQRVAAGGTGGGGWYGGGGGAASASASSSESGGGGGGSSHVEPPAAPVSASLSTSTSGAVTISTEAIDDRPFYVTPESLDFGTVAPGTTSAPQELRIVNQSGSDRTLSIFPTSGGGTPNPDFVLDSRCPQTLPDNSSCTIVVRATPTGAGPRSAGIGIGGISFSGGSTIITGATFTVIGAGPPDATITPSPVAFGRQPVGQQAARDLTITNTGGSPLTISAFSKTGAAFDRSRGNCPDGPIAPGGTCTVRAFFTPTAAGDQTGTLTPTTNDPTPPTVGLSGTGVLDAALALTPPSQRIDPTRSVPITATVTRADGGAAISGAAVQVTVTGANATGPRVLSTGADGKATYNAFAVAPGTTTVTACVDEDGDGTFCEDGEPQETATITVVAPVLTLTPASASATAGDAVTFTATFRQAISGTALGGSTVHFDVTGPNAQTRDVPLTGTPASAALTYTGAQAGTDTVSACVDEDRSGACDPGETFRATATATFAAPAADPRTQVDATAGKASVSGTVDCDLATANAKRRPLTVDYTDAKGARHTFTASTDGTAYKLSKCSSTSQGTKHIGTVRGTIDGGTTSHEVSFTFVDGGEGAPDRLGIQLKVTGSSTLLFNQAIVVVTQGDVVSAAA